MPPAPLPTRRQFLQLAGSASTVGLLGACGGFSTGGGGGGAGGPLVFLTWAGDAEKAGYDALVESFRADTGIDVRIDVVPYSEILTTVDTGLRSPSPPDLFRVSYTDVGVYRGQDVLATVPDVGELERALLPAFFSAVTDDQGTFGVPQHTDTSMVLVNTAAAQAAGLGALPTTVDTAWTWEEFRAAAARLQSAATAGSRAFAVNWSNAGAYRWLNWVDQAGGRLLTDDLTGSALADDAGARAAMEFTRSFFADGLVPPENTTTGQPASDLFTNQTVAMCFAGDFLLGEFAGVPFEYTATFLPRNERASADLGGNALVAVKGGPREEEALQFVAHCAGRDQMAGFCATANVLPTRTDIDAATLEFPVRPDLMPLYVQQASTISLELVEQVVVPTFAAVNAALRTGLERAFASTGDIGAAAAALSEAVQDALTR